MDMTRKLPRLRQITDDATALKIEAMIAGTLDPREVSEATDRWVRQCYHEPSLEEQTLHAADTLLDTYGVEGICNDAGSKGVSWCNTGDPYDLCLCLTYPAGRFSVRSQPT